MLEICERCGDTQKLETGACPVCRQQAVHQGHPLAILREGHFQERRQSGRMAGPAGRFRLCAVVALDDDEYLTACGEIIARGCSVTYEPPNCKACRKALRGTEQRLPD